MYYRLSTKFSKCPRFQAETESYRVPVEQILDVPVPEMVEQLVKLPKTVSEDGIQQPTVEQIVDILDPQDVEEPAEFFKASTAYRLWRS